MVFRIYFRQRPMGKFETVSWFLWPKKNLDFQSRREENHCYSHPWYLRPRLKNRKFLCLRCRVFSRQRTVKKQVSNKKFILEILNKMKDLTLNMANSSLVNASALAIMGMMLTFLFNFFKHIISSSDNLRNKFTKIQ